jgi:adenylosuccinate lyase
MGRIWSEAHRLETWLRVELALVEALEELGQAPRGTAERIRGRVQLRPERMRELEETLQHDVLAFLTSLTEQLGPEGRYLHLGMTSSDLVDTALSLLVREACEVLREDLQQVLEQLRELALRYKDLPMVGRTHGIHAEPITLGLKFLSWWAEGERGRERLEEAASGMRFGKLSGAVGTLAHLSPEVEARTLRRLGLEPEPVATQVVPRDRHAHLVATLGLLGSSLERWATEIRHLQRTEVAELEEPFRRGQKGSSAMPHKRNPIRCERMTGLARLLRSYVVPALENVPLWHERDISHSSVERVILPDAFILLDYALGLFGDVLAGLTIREERIRRNLELTGGLLFSQRVLLALTERMGSRERAYALVQEASRKVWEEGGTLRERLLEAPEVRRHLDAEAMDRLFDLRSFLGNVEAIFQRTLEGR